MSVGLKRFNFATRSASPESSRVKMQSSAPITAKKEKKATSQGPCSRTSVNPNTVRKLTTTSFRTPVSMAQGWY